MQLRLALVALLQGLELAAAVMDQVLFLMLLLHSAAVVVVVTM
jgi:hypothetical protein